MKRLLVGVAIGFFCGAVALAYLAQRAASDFLEMARGNYELEEELAAMCATERGDMNGAATHYANLVSARSLGSIWAWSELRDGWTIGFPLLVLEWNWRAAERGDDAPAVDQRTKLRARIDGMYRARLADALTRAGREPEAEVEYARATTLLGDAREVQLAVAHPPEQTLGSFAACDSPGPRIRAAANRVVPVAGRTP